MEKKIFTLISFVGKNLNKYDYVTYKMPENGELCEGNDTSIALIMAENQHWNITKAIIIGTYSSNWFELIDENDNKVLYDKLREASNLSFESDEDVGLIDSLLDEMVDYLQDEFSIEIIPVAHRPDLTDKTISEISDYYDRIYEEVSDSPNILIDITHGFRTMPLLLFQMIQQHLLQLENKEVELVYGERYDEKTEDGTILKYSEFKNLKQYWDVSKRSDALNRFITTFDGSGLLPYLKESGLITAEKWLRSFTNIVKSGYILQINHLINELPAVIETLSQPDSTPWVRRFKEELRKISACFYACSQLYELYVTFAHMLDERKMLTQAVIAVDIAIQCKMAIYKARCEHLDDLMKYVGNYKFWQGENYDGAKMKLRRMLSKKWQEYFDKFYQRRNRIAHGGGETWKNGVISDTAFNMTKCFELAEVIFEILDKKEKKLKIDKNNNWTLGELYNLSVSEDKK